MLYTCAPDCADPAHKHGSASARRVRSAALAVARAASSSVPSRRSRSPVVDIHCHYLNPEVAAASADLDVGSRDPSVIYANELTRATNAAQMKTRASKLTGIDERLDDMDRMGVEVQVISPAPFQYFYFTGPERGAALARQVNEGIAQLVAQTPERFAGMGSVPLQNAEIAVQELDYAMGQLALCGVEINTNVNGLNLTDPQLGLEPFFARANELAAVIFLHPLGFSDGQRLTNHYFNNVIGNPLETTVAISHLIFDGVVARYPNIKFIAAHGGGYVAHYWGRMDHAWRARPDCRTVIDQPPSTYLKTFYVDALVFDPEILRHLVETFGSDRVLLGTDYPYDMGEENPREFIASVRGLSAQDVARIEGLNAVRLLNIAASP